MNAGPCIVHSEAFRDEAPQVNPPPVLCKGDIQFWEVEAIVGHSYTWSRGWSVKVKWWGWEELTDEPLSHIHNLGVYVDYWRRQQHM